MRKQLATLSLAALLGMAGCYSAPVVPPQGILYSGISAPLDTDLDQTDLGAKRGASGSTSILGLIAWGDASASTAARSAGIGKIKHADYEYTNILGIYQKFTTVVYGD